jgi:putative two-component system response regulator
MPFPATILVADDLEENRDILAALLEAEGYRVVLAEDGEETMELLATGMVDLVLLDVVMPRCDGFEACRRIKNNPQTQLLPVVLTTGLNSTEDRVRGIECGADDFLNKPIKREELTARVRSLLRIKKTTDELERAETVLFSLALSIEAKDPYTEGHCDRLSRYGVALGRRLGMTEEELIALRRGGVIHDLGKIGVPDHILLKPGPLTAEEWLVMKKHPEIGERICQPLRSFGLVLPIIRHHHEKFDGSGYPDRLKGSAIPLTAQVLATVDVYDALTTDRPYRQAIPPEQALEVMDAEVQRGWWNGDLIAEMRVLVREGQVHALLRESTDTVRRPAECAAPTALPFRFSARQ